MKICEIFSTIQGEGRFAGTPTLFIRLSGCSRACGFCDTKYHVKSRDMSVKDIVKKIKKSKYETVCWTGGEALLQKDEVYRAIKATRNKNHLLETNGDFLEPMDFLYFNNITCSPKDLVTAKKVSLLKRYYSFDIKVVSDLKKLNISLLKYADYIMPLSTGKRMKDLETAAAVWHYCAKHNKMYAARLNYLIFGNKRGI